LSRLLAIAFILFCFEVGLFLIIVPWSGMWDENMLLDYAGFLRPIVLHTAFRVVVSVLGSIDVLIGLVELRNFFRSFKIANRSTP
jgi:hypothetical protein